MRRFRGVVLVISVLTVLATTSGMAGATPLAAGGDISADDFDPSLFDENSANLTNEWVAYDVGKRFSWRGSTVEDGEKIPHGIVFTITDLTKVIGGVRTRIGWDRDFTAGTLEEMELIFLAQDKNGNVWHFGQYAEIYDEEGGLVGGSPWLVGGLEGAKAGIHMKADPKLGSPAYSQGYAPPPYYWDDFSKVRKLDARTCVPTGCYDNVLVIDEFEPTKPGAFQVKYYARGVGNVRTGWKGKTEDHEVLTLRKITQIDAQEMARVRAIVYEMEKRAYVYASTPPAEIWPADSTE